MKSAILTLLLVSLPLCGRAQDTEDLLSNDTNPFYAGKPRAAGTNDAATHCKELRRQMAELKNRPQRHHAVSRRYQLECTPAMQMPGQSGLQ
ncbi:MAG: hypothetical protein R3330_07140 [Saprospiraceae bacterium]|nr:hypothetical protein [Saprospiraceae bacterium]